MRNRKDGNEYGGGLTEFVKKGQICKKVSENVTSEIIVSEIKESGKKPHFGTQFFLIQKSGFLIHQISQSAITMPNIRKKLMIQSREGLKTDGRTDRQTDGWTIVISKDAARNRKCLQASKQLDYLQLI